MVGLNYTEDADSVEECEGVGYGEGIIGQGFTSNVWDLNQLVFCE